MDCGSIYESSILSGHPRPEGGSVSGKPPVFEAGFGRSIRSPPATGRWRNLAARRALNAEVPGSRPGRPASFSRVSFNGQDRTLRTFRLRFDSSYAYQGFGRSSNRTGHSAPNAEIGVGIPTGRPFRGVGRLVRHLIVDQGDAGSIPVHRAKFSGLSSNGRISGSQPEDASSTLAGPTMGVSSNWQGSPAFNRRMRDRAPPPLPVFGL